MLNGTRRVTGTIKQIIGTDKLLDTTNTNVGHLGEQVLKINTNLGVLEAGHVALAGVVANNAEVLQKGLERLENMYNKMTSLIVSKEIISAPVNVGGSKIYEMIITLQDQIKALSQNGLNCNGDIQVMLKQITSLETKMSLILSEQKMSAVEAVNISNNNSLIAADRRWVEEARNQLKSFDLEANIKNIKASIGEQLKPIVNDIQSKIDSHLETATKSSLDNKITVHRKVESLRDEIKQHSKDLSEFKTETNGILAKRVEGDNLQTQVMDNLDQKITATEKKVRAVDETIAEIKTTVKLLKTEFITLRDMLNNTLMEMQVHYTKTLEQVKESFKLAEKQAMVVGQTVRQVNTDNRNITAGLLAPITLSTNHDKPSITSFLNPKKPS